MAKIEKPQAVARLGDIIDFTDALMVARGDLGVEMPLEKVPGIQKQMTRAARAPASRWWSRRRCSRSMITSPVPTRAEVSDVATAIFEGADAVMLSAESAAGQFPVEAVATMNRIAEEVENDPTYRTIMHAQRTEPGSDRRRRDRGGGAPDRRDARPLRRSSAGPRSGSTALAGRARAAEIADRRDLAQPRDRAPAVAGLGRALHRRRGRARPRRHGGARLPACLRDNFRARRLQRVIIVAGVPLPVRRAPPTCCALRLSGRDAPGINLTRLKIREWRQLLAVVRGAGDAYFLYLHGSRFLLPGFRTIVTLSWWQDWLLPSIALSGAAAAFYFTRKWVKNRRRFLGRDDRRSDCFPELVTITSARGLTSPLLPTRRLLPPRAIGRHVMRHVADAFEHDELALRQPSQRTPRMDVG